MTAARKSLRTTRTYVSPLRASQAEMTMSTIVDAAYEELKTTRPEHLSYTVLAERTDIAPKTIYRHFPKRDDLVRAVARKLLMGVLGPEMRVPTDFASQAEMLGRLHELFSSEPGTYRVMLGSPTRSGAGDVAGLVRTSLGDGLRRTPKAQRDSACAVFELFISPYFWDACAEHWNVKDPARITRAAIVMMDLVIDALAKDPEMFDPKRPPPKRYRKRATDKE